MWTDEGYGPTWDSDDEYDNFIRKMNPPRCIHIHMLLFLLLHPQKDYPPVFITIYTKRLTLWHYGTEGVVQVYFSAIRSCFLILVCLSR